MYPARTGASAVAGGRGGRRRASLGPLLVSDGLCPRRKLFSFVRVLHRPQQRPIVVQSGGHSGVLWSKALLLDRQRPRIQRLRLSVPSQNLVEVCEVGQAFRHVRVFRSEVFLPDRQRPRVEIFCLCIPLLVLVEDCQLFRVSATSGCSSPRAFSWMARGRA